MLWVAVCFMEYLDEKLTFGDALYYIEVIKTKVSLQDKYWNIFSEWVSLYSAQH